MRGFLLREEELSLTFLFMRNRIYDREGHIHFVTFSCYRRRKLLASDRCRQVVLGVLAQELEKRNGHCLGFVIMPDHVHCLLWFAENDQLSEFIKVWKGRASYQIKRKITDWIPDDARTFDSKEPVWQKRFFMTSIFVPRIS